MSYSPDNVVEYPTKRQGSETYPVAGLLLDYGIADLDNWCLREGEVTEVNHVANTGTVEIEGGSTLEEVPFRIHTDKHYGAYIYAGVDPPEDPEECFEGGTRILVMREESAKVVLMYNKVDPSLSFIIAVADSEQLENGQVCAPTYWPYLVFEFTLVALNEEDDDIVTYFVWDVEKEEEAKAINNTEDGLVTFPCSADELNNFFSIGYDGSDDSDHFDTNSMVSQLFGDVEYQPVYQAEDDYCSDGTSQAWTINTDSSEVNDIPLTTPCTVGTIALDYESSASFLATGNCVGGSSYSSSHLTEYHSICVYVPPNPQNPNGWTTWEQLYRLQDDQETESIPSGAVEDPMLKVSIYSRDPGNLVGGRMEMDVRLGDGTDIPTGTYTPDSSYYWNKTVSGRTDTEIITTESATFTLDGKAFQHDGPHIAIDSPCYGGGGGMVTDIETFDNLRGVGIITTYWEVTGSGGPATLTYTPQVCASYFLDKSENRFDYSTVFSGKHAELTNYIDQMLPSDPLSYVEFNKYRLSIDHWFVWAKYNIKTLALELEA